MKKKIDFRLFPDVVYNGIVYSNYDADKHEMLQNHNVPFIKAWNVAEAHKRVLLIGDGSLGKSTSLQVFQAKKLYNDELCLLHECRSINNSDILKISRMLDAHKDCTFVFDALDELPDSITDSFIALIKELNNADAKVIVSCRYDPRTDYATAEIRDAFSSFASMKLCSFTERQLDSIVSKEITRSSGYFSLLKTTFFLVLHMEIEDQKLISKLSDSVKTEADFIQQYFSLTYLDKHVAEIEMSDFIHLGKYIHQQRLGKNNRHKERIPAPLKHILKYRISADYFQEGSNILDSDQLKYLDYFHAVYIKDQVQELCDECSKEEFKDGLIKLFNLPSTSENAESFYYAGQLLHSETRCVKKILVTVNESEFKKSVQYENVLSFFLGYNHDVAEDIPGVFDFYHAKMQEDKYSYLNVCDRIRELRAQSIEDVSFAFNGCTQLEKIDINNAIFYSRGNCLVKRIGDELYLGCKNSVIPEGVLFIHRYAFSHCAIKRISVPDSVGAIDQFAFLYCDVLEYVELGINLTKLSECAFYKCRAIKELCIKNTCMRIGDIYYDKSAFVEMYHLEKATVPTTAIDYVYKPSWKTLRRLEITQGTYPLDLNNIGEIENKLETIVIHQDVNSIVEDAFMKFKNNLKEIIVEAGNEYYKSVNHSLISVAENKLMLGSNSTEEVDGVDRIVNYAFARCYDLKRIKIKNVKHISENAFYKCLSLEAVEFQLDQLSFVAREAFRKCVALKEVVIDDIANWLKIEFSTTSDSNPLYYAKLLKCNGEVVTTVEVPIGVRKIYSGAFTDCLKIEKIIFSSTVEEVGGCAFLHCYDIREVYAPDLESWCKIQFNSFSANPLSNGSLLFVDGEEVKELTFTSNTPIKRFAFVRTPSIESVIFNEGCEIGEQAFDGCPNLVKVIIKSPNVKIHPSAFKGCAVELDFLSSESDWKSVCGDSNLEGVTSIVFNK